MEEYTERLSQIEFSLEENEAEDVYLDWLGV